MTLKKMRGGVLDRSVVRAGGPYTEAAALLLGSQVQLPAFAVCLPHSLCPGFLSIYTVNEGH